MKTHMFPLHIIAKTPGVRCNMELFTFHETSVLMVLLSVKNSYSDNFAFCVYKYLFSINVPPNLYIITGLEQSVTEFELLNRVCKKNVITDQYAL